MNEKKIKLLICYHKKSPLFKDDILTPIHVGRANAKKRLDPDSENYKWLMTNLIGDDTGENISDRNDSYNEMTALYWAWKNYEELGNPDYVGLMHYRRHFVLKENVQAVYNVKDYTNKERYYGFLNYSPEKMQELVDGCDFLTHIGKVKGVYKHFIENQRIEDIDTANEIMLELYPEYKDVAKEYYEGELSNFCNMNIFSKEIFFKYCEFVFSILEEFERRVDINEKRFFISERLTGVFVAKLMKDEKLKHKILPLAFIEEPADVPVVMNVTADNYTDVATTMTSIMENSRGYNSFHFYLVHNSNVNPKFLEKYKIYERKYTKCTVDFVQSDVAEEYIPLHVPTLLPKVNKCIYIAGKVLSIFDIGEFYRICSTDDYYVVGVPAGDKYEPEAPIKEIESEFIVINSKRMRNPKVMEKAAPMIAEGVEGNKALNVVCKGEIGYIPWYLVTSEKLSPYGKKIISDEQTRNTIQNETGWRPFLVYDLTDPVANNQGVYSIFWWNNMKKLPLPFQKIDANMNVICNIYTEQQKEINAENIMWEGAPIRTTQSQTQADEDWRSYSTWGKLKYYKKHNGMKKTVSYCFKKVFKRKDK